MQTRERSSSTARGYQPRVSLTSSLITLGGARTLSSIEWEGDTPPGTSIALRSRTGNQLADVLRYFKKDGSEITEEQYNKLNKFAKKDIEIVTEQVAGGDWSDWSEEYDFSGSPITSPSPRAYLMLQAYLKTSDPQQAASLRSIRLNFLDPLAQQALGELEPGLVSELGAIDTLSLFVKAEFLRGGPGMDQIRLYAPGVDLELQLLRMGLESQWDAGPVAELGPADLEQIPTGADSLWVRLDSAVGPEVDLIEVRFTTTLFRPGAILQAELGTSSEANRWQRVDPGDATDPSLEPGDAVARAVGRQAGDGPVDGQCSDPDPERGWDQRRSAVRVLGAPTHRAAHGEDPPLRSGRRLGAGVGGAASPRERIVRGPLVRPRPERPAGAAWDLPVGDRGGRGRRRIEPQDAPRGPRSVLMPGSIE